MGVPSGQAGASDVGGPLIERNCELAAAERALDDLAEGRAAVLAISGEPGIGKTRLARETAALAEARGSRVLWGRATATALAVPFAPFVDALDPALPEADELALGGASEQSIRSLLERLASGGSLVLFLDDFHAADDASIALLADLVRTPTETPILVVPICSSGRWPAVLTHSIHDPPRRGDLTEIDLGPLSPNGIEALLSASLDADTRRRIHTESGGNPRYALELDRAAARDGSVSDAGVPSTLLAVITEEVGSLSEPALATLRAAAVVGDPFEPELVTSVAQVARSAAPRGLDELIARGLVQRFSPVRCGFRRPIVRRAVYEEMGLAPRLAAHERAARALGARNGPLMARAHHLEHGGRSGEDDVALLLEAALSTSSTKPATAARWFVAALRGMDGTDDRRLTTLMHASAELVSAGRLAEGREAFEEMNVLLSTGASVPAPALCSAARSAHMLALPNPARTLIQDALEREPDGASAVAMRIALGMDHWRTHELGEMTAQARLALDGARTAGDRGLQAYACSLLALAEYAGGATTQALEHVVQAEGIVRTLPDESLAGRLECLLLLGYTSHGLERYAGAAEHFQRGVDIAHATGNSFFLVSLRVGVAAVAVATGKLGEACDAAAVALDGATEIGSPQLAMWAYALKSRLSSAQARPHVALEAAERAARAADQVSSGFLATGAHLCLGVARIEAGAAQAGREQILRHAGGPRLGRLDAGLLPAGYAALAASAIELRDLDAARDWVERAEASADALGIGGRWASARMARATLLLSRAESTAAVAVADEAAAAFDAAGRTLDAGRALALAGQARALGGDDDGAVSTLERAHAIFAASEAERHRDLAAQELRRLGRTTARPPGRGTASASIAGLTRREREVAELVAQGLTNRRIAEEIFVSARTVEDHVARACSKLGVSSRAGVAAAFEAARTP